MKKIFYLLIAFQIACVACIGQVTLKNLLCENLTNPIGLDEQQPRFSWQLHSQKKNVMQGSYEIRVNTNPALLKNNRNNLWHTGKILSGQSVYVPYMGNKLQSGQKYYWQVRIWDNTGKASAWSEIAHWQMGLLNESDWKAKWIEPGYIEDSVSRPSPLFRKQFNAGKSIESATVYITAHGLYEAEINGRRVGNDYLTPGWTSYKTRLQYQVYDVTDLVKKDANVIAVTLGSGWYRGYIGFSGQQNYYGKDISLLFQLDIKYKDGTSELITSDETWKSSTGSIRRSEIYHGETIDNRLEKVGWKLTGYDEAGWSGVRVANHSGSNLIATYNEPIKKQETFKPVRLFVTPKGERVIDFGQNLVGWVILKVKGKAGDKITVSHAEVLDKEGNFYITNLRAAEAKDIYYLKGESEETFEPHFTFHGFQFIKIEGYTGELSPENFTAVALYSDMKKTGTFSSSNALINQLQKNIEWGQKGNFLDVPTDCPQRDERLGWTGDAQVFSRTAAFNMGVNNFFSKWLKDVAADQVNGSVPFVVPNVLGPGAVASAGWADAATIIPWNMYLAYGDKRILEEQYPSMKAWVDYMQTKSKNDLWNTGFHFGDWLFYRPFDDNDGRSAVTDKYLIAQCFFAHSTQLLVSAASVLEKTSDVTTYSDLLKRIKDAFIKEYMTTNGRLVSGTQTAYVLALNFDMLPETFRIATAERLVQNIKDYNYHLTTGFLGTPYLCHVLSRFGHTDIAYRLLLQETYPSWLYPVKMGATTIWERWNGIKPDSTFETPGMNSFNHYAYGAIGDWMYRVVAGIDTYEDDPGYKHISIKPQPGPGLNNASADLETYYGKVSSHWKVDTGKLTLDVEIPPNTTASIYIPATNEADITERGSPLASIKDLKVIRTEKGYVVLETGSGVYHFEVKR